MNIDEKLTRLEERRGETANEWMSKFYNTPTGDANEEIVRLAELLATADANTTSEVIDLVGGLEHYTPYQSIGDSPFFFTGLEGISDNIVRIFDRIITFIKRWIRIFTDADFKLSLFTAMHSSALENIRTRMRTEARKAKDQPTFTITTRLQNISVNHRPVTNCINLLNALTVLKAVTENYFTDHADNVLRQVKKVIENVNGQSSATHLAELTSLASPTLIGNKSIMRMQVGHYISPNLLGNHRFMITDDNFNSTDIVERLQSIRVKLVPSENINPQPLEFVRFEHFDNHMTESVLTKCETILNTLASSNNGPHRYARRQALDALLACVEKVNKDVQQNGLNNEDDARRVVAVLESYIAWIADPYTDFYSYVIRNVKAALNVCEANIA